ncbi:hypothetical protein [Streptomyces sp. NPDC002845]
MVIVTAFGLDAYVYGTLQAGAAGFVLLVLKDAGPVLRNPFAAARLESPVWGRDRRLGG